MKMVMNNSTQFWHSIYKKNLQIKKRLIETDAIENSKT